MLSKLGTVIKVNCCILDGAKTIRSLIYVCCVSFAKKKNCKIFLKIFYITVREARYLNFLLAQTRIKKKNIQTSKKYCINKVVL